MHLFPAQGSCILTSLLFCFETLLYAVPSPLYQIRTLSTSHNSTYKGNRTHRVPLKKNPGKEKCTLSSSRTSKYKYIFYAGYLQKLLYKYKYGRCKYICDNIHSYNVCKLLKLALNWVGSLFTTTFLLYLLIIS